MLITVNYPSHNISCFILNLLQNKKKTSEKLAVLPLAPEISLFNLVS